MTYAQLKETLSYDPGTGEFRWLHRKGVPPRINKRFVGKVAGSVFKVRGGAYLHICVGGHRYLAHRLAWFYMTGEWPEHQIDHKNCDGLDNRWDNLRKATGSQNLANTRLAKDNTTGFKGVVVHKGKYQAQIGYKGATRYLGRFDTPEEASTAYSEAAKRLYGEYARAS